MAINMGRAFKGTGLDISNPAEIAQQLIGAGKNKVNVVNDMASDTVAKQIASGGNNRLNTANLNTLSPFQSNPVDNLFRGITDKTDPVRQAMGKSMPSWTL